LGNSEKVGYFYPHKDSMGFREKVGEELWVEWRARTG